MRVDPAPVITTYAGSPCTPMLLWQTDGVAAGDRFGCSVRSGYDWGGDGTQAIAVGAPHADPGTGPSGSVSVYYGALAEHWEYYWNLNSEFGRSVCFVTDIDHDGASEVVVGGPNHDGGGADSAGVVTVMGKSNFLIFSFIGTGVGDKLGYSVADADDVDHDLYNDIIVGAPGARGPLGDLTGYVLILSPKLNDILHRFDGAEPGAMFGRTVAYGGDLDNNGVGDFLIGAPRASVFGTPAAHVGAVFVYRSDGTLIWRYNGANPDDYFGDAVSGSDDLNGDNQNEVIIGAWGADPGGVTDAGSVYVYSGATHALLYRLDGDGPNQHFGYAVTATCDVDGDGYDDILVGAPQADPAGRTDAGTAYVYSAHTGALLWKIEGAAAGDLLGSSVAGRGDPALLHTCEVVVGAMGTDPGGRIDAGSAYLFGCACDCPCKYDPQCDGVISDILDVSQTINVAFRGQPATKDPLCPVERTDVDASHATDVLDVTKVINVAFRGQSVATNYVDPCAP
jgi:hypothetical protein